MKKPPHWLALSAVGLIATGAAGLVSCAQPQPATGPATRLATTQPATTQSAKRLCPTHFGPIGYFEDHCARCHGPYGSFYGPDFAKQPADQLRQTLQHMAEGPGNAPVTDEQLDLLLAYHQALAAHRPFVTLVDIRRDKGGVHLQGEVTPGARVAVDAQCWPVPATITDHTWTVTLPPGTDGECFMVLLMPMK